MTYTPFEIAGSMQIGTVEFVSPDEIKVKLLGEAPESMALNTGIPRPFPRVHDYLLVLVGDGYLVGQVEWITIGESSVPSKHNEENTSLVELPYPRRRLSLNPLGKLRLRENEEGFVFRRGSEALPSVGEAVMLPSQSQLQGIIEGAVETHSIRIGTNPFTGNATVRVDPDKLFGRHLAVLGNTGSGKSCTVAGLIRWSLVQAKRDTGPPGANARFVILDPNGEYSKAFSQFDPDVPARIFKVNAGDHESPLRVPLWFWNSEEWGSFTHASPGAQLPLLKRALREIKVGRNPNEDLTSEQEKLYLRRFLSERLVFLQTQMNLGPQGVSPNAMGSNLRAFKEDIEDQVERFPDQGLSKTLDSIGSVLEEKASPFPDKLTGKMVDNFKTFSNRSLMPVVESLEETIDALGGIIYHKGPSEDVPLPFKGAELADYLELLARLENKTQFVDFLVARIRTLLADSKFSAIVDDPKSTSLKQWLDDYIGSDSVEDGRIRIIDLSLVPSEHVHIITAVVARTIFEAHQRYAEVENTALPTVLIMEEAHTFIKKYNEFAEYKESSTICCQVFERIAREGRKFGLNLVLSSQRPSELSPTVLSQCNTFLLHRISNNHDQDIVRRLVPDNLRGLLRELPILPSQTAILLGWAAELPILVRIDDLQPEVQPRSDDPDIWNVWTRRTTRKLNWNKVTRIWQEQPQKDI